METDTLTAPAVVETPLFVEPTAADRQARKATAAPPAPMPPDPDAPFGYMTDRLTGEVRPRKTAGRQPKQPKRVAAPHKRPAGKARAIAPPAGVPAPPGSPAQPASHAAQVGEVIDGLWMVVAAMPSPPAGARVFGLDLAGASVRTKAQAAVLADNRNELAFSVGAMADHVPIIARGVAWLAKEDGPAWVIPAMMALVPFAAQTAAIWRAPLEDIEHLATQTTTRFAEVLATHQASVQASVAAVPAPAPAPYPGEQPLPGLGG